MDVGAVKAPTIRRSHTCKRTRHLFIRQKTSVINAIRAHLAEFGIHKFCDLRADARDAQDDHHNSRNHNRRYGRVLRNPGTSAFVDISRSPSGTSESQVELE